MYKIVSARILDRRKIFEAKRFLNVKDKEEMIINRPKELKKLLTNIKRLSDVYMLIKLLFVIIVGNNASAIIETNI